MTTSIGSDALLNHKKDTWEMKFKKEEPKILIHQKIMKPLNIFVKVLHLCLLQPNRQTGD